MFLSSDGLNCIGCVASAPLSSSPHNATYFHSFNIWQPGNDTQLRTPSLPSPPILYKPAGGVYQRVPIFRRSQLHRLCSKCTSLFLPPTMQHIFIVSTYGSQGMIRSSPHQHYHRPPSSIYPYEVYTNVFLSSEGLNLNGFVEAEGRVNIKDTSTFHVPNGW